MNPVTISPTELKQILYAAELLERNIQRPLTISELAICTQLSQTKLKKLFKEVNDISIYQYVVRIRIKKAQSLLLQDIPIKVISEELGYSTESNFCKTFRKGLGESPKRWLLKTKQGRRIA